MNAMTWQLLLLSLATYLVHTSHSLTLTKTTSSNGARPAAANADKSHYTADFLSTKVKCTDKKAFCECNKPNSNPDSYSCSFSELRVEELQTFVSYEYRQEHDPIVSDFLTRVHPKATKRNSAGDVYYLLGKGFTPALPPKPDNKDTFKPPEYGPCFSNKTLITDTRQFGEFSDFGCSVPATVDGSTYRMFIGVNGQIPGPTLIVYEGQLVRIRVRNKLTSETISIHWHGFHQKETPWMDGVGLVSQPPITPGAYFDYIFRAPNPGTYWYHSHVGAQRTDGLYGAFIVKEHKQGKTLNDYTKLTGGEHVHDCPENHTLTLLDWQRESSLGVFVRIHSTLGFFLNNEIGKVPNEFVNLNIRSRSSDGVEVGPVPFWSGLINGKGRHTRETYSILSDFNVTKGNRYRFRLVGAQSVYAFKFSIDNHKLIVIASDSRYIIPVKVDFIIIHSGERFDFILDADQEVNNYWIRAETLEANIQGTHMAEAILRYEGAQDLDPWNKYVDIPDRPKSCNFLNRCKAINCPFESFPWKMYTRCEHLDELKAFDTKEDVPDIVEVDDPNLLFFNFGFEGRSDTSAINGWNFHLPTTPYQTYCDQYDHDKHPRDMDSSDKVCRINDSQDEDADYPTCIHVREIAQQETTENRNPSVNFVLSAVGDIAGRYNDFSHPIHLHGHHFRVVAVRHGKYDRSGKLIENNPDVTCGTTKSGEIDLHCRKPHWKDGIPPDFMRDQRPNVGEKILKDTVIVPAGGYVVIAFEADNPGYWFMHCHIESHQLEGMAVIIQEFPEARQWTPPPDINRVGNFYWCFDDFQKFTGKQLTCPVNK